MISKTKLTWGQLETLFTMYNETKARMDAVISQDDKLHAVVVFKASNWPDNEYSLDSRSYHITSNNKAFRSYCAGRSCYASALDGSDSHVDLLKYDWEVDYCYLI